MRSRVSYRTFAIHRSFGRERRPEADLLGLALQLEGRTFLEARHGVQQQAARGLGEQDVVAGLARRLLDPRRRVDGVADHGELDVPAAADGPGHDRAGVDADADAQLVAVALPDHRGDL